MTQWHTKSKRKITGGIRYSVRASDRKLIARGGDPAATTLAEKEPKRDVRVKRGTSIKVKLKSEKNVIVNEKGKSRKMEIISVELNDADRQFARRNIITKGAILKVKDGEKEVFVKVTNRPGQQGDIQGIITDYQKAEKITSRKKEKAAAKKKNTKKSPKKAKETPKSE